MFWALYSLLTHQNSTKLNDQNHSENPKDLDKNPLFTAAIIKKIMEYLDLKSSINMLLLSPQISTLACDSFYSYPKFKTTTSFPNLVKMLTKPTLHPYALFIKELRFEVPIGDEMLIGDLRQLLLKTTQIHTLTFIGLTQLSTVLIPSLVTLPNLKRICLKACLVPKMLIEEILKLNLVEVDLQFSNTIIDLQSILDSSIENVNLSGCLGNGNYDGFEAWNGKSRLRIVNLSFTQIDDQCLRYMVKRAPGLEKISLEGCKLVTDDGVLAIGMHCPNLVELDLGGCKVTDLGVQSLAVHLADSWRRLDREGNVPLRVLKLSKCDVTRKSVQLLARKCPNLDEIVLDGCEKISDWYLGTRPEEIEVVDEDSDTASFVSDDGWNMAMSEKKMKRLSVSRKQILEK
jgi:Leucine Rich repeat